MAEQLLSGSDGLFEALPNCTGGVDWIMDWFGECVQTPANMIAFILGFISLILWLIPMIPQVYENYTRKQCEGISIYFLLFWIAGDASNLTGALLTQQLPIQIYIGIYYIFADVVLLSQFVYYNNRNRILQRRLAELSTDSPRRRVAVLLLALCIGGLGYERVCGSTLDGNEYLLDSEFVGRSGGHYRRLQHQFFHNGYDELGYIIGSISAILYFAGRVPQLVKNHRRQSTDGLSLSMFVIIVFANLTYGTSVFFAGQGTEYILRHLPWLVGSLGCCFLDALVIGQYCLYDAPRVTPEEEEHLTGFKTDDESDTEP